MKIYIIKTTYPSTKEANKLVDCLLQKHLASCIQLSNIQSHYIWEGRISCEKEVLVSIKTTKNNAKIIESTIYKTHPYKIPQIIIFKAKASKQYLKWHTKSITGNL